MVVVLRFLPRNEVQRSMGPGDAEATSLMRWLGFYATDGQEDCVAIVLRLLELA